jgi:multidrug resistance efflux pump
MMEILLLGIYSAIVWLIFIKLKWLPWNTGTQVVVVIIPIVGLTALILSLNVVAPSTSDVRVIKYVVNVVPQVRGRVIEVPAEPNRLIKRGDVLFRIDPTPYELRVRALEAQLANTSASGKELDEQLAGAAGKVVETRGATQQADAKVNEIQSKLDLAVTRVGQNRQLVSSGAGDRFALERAETDVKELNAQLQMARSAAVQARAGEVQASASERQIRQRLAGKFGGEYAPVAQVRAELDVAKWDLAQTTLTAPADGYAINVQLRPGSYTVAFPLQPAMNFVEQTYQVIALYQQNELHQVEPGNEAEFTLDAYPGRIIKATVDSVVWAQGQGQVQSGQQLPMTGYGPMPAGRFPVKLIVAPQDAELFLPAGAVGHGAIYTNSGEAIHILRKIILRIGAKLDYLILKLH